MSKRALAFCAALAAFTMAVATPTSAQEPSELTGSVECIQPGVFEVTWTIENFIGADGAVDSAILSGAADGDITGAFAPNPFTGDDELIVGSHPVSGDTVGTLTLDVTLTFELKGPFEFEDSAEVELDGSCEAPPTTQEEPTTSTSAAPAGTVRPTFTG